MISLYFTDKVKQCYILSLLNRTFENKQTKKKNGNHFIIRSILMDSYETRGHLQSLNKLII